MAEAETISFSERVSIAIAEGVAEARLDRPDKLNALDGAMFDGLIAAGEHVSREKGVRAVVLYGAGRGFCAGLDTQIFASIASRRHERALGDIVRRTHGDANAAQQAALVWRGVPVPVIAAVHGPCFGGGFQIALGADMRYVAPDARLSILEIKWGIVPDMGGIALMRELAGGDVIRELAFTGREFTGGHCQSNFYTARSRPRAGWSSTVFAHELPPRLAGFRAENRHILICLDSAGPALRRGR